MKVSAYVTHGVFLQQAKSAQGAAGRAFTSFSSPTVPGTAEAVRGTEPFEILCSATNRRGPARVRDGHVIIII